MDQVTSYDADEKERWKEIVSALGGGIVVVDATGKIVWIDERTRLRLDGGLKHLDLPLQRSTSGAMDCFVSVETVDVGGTPTAVCIVQETEGPDRAMSFTIDSVLAETSAFARNIMDRLKGLRIEQSASMSDLDVLTEREREILGLICRGKSDLEMSRDLNLSHNTVRNHIASLYRKIGVNRRSAAIIWARERGITGDALSGRRRRPSPSDFPDT
jgi:DNA-binding CsgD family transcriptional regulator